MICNNESRTNSALIVNTWYFSILMISINIDHISSGHKIRIRILAQDKGHSKGQFSYLGSPFPLISAHCLKKPFSHLWPQWDGMNSLDSTGYDQSIGPNKRQRWDLVCSGGSQLGQVLMVWAGVSPNCLELIRARREGEGWKNGVGLWVQFKRSTTIKWEMTTAPDTYAIKLPRRLSWWTTCNYPGHCAGGWGITCEVGNNFPAGKRSHGWSCHSRDCNTDRQVVWGRVPLCKVSSLRVLGEGHWRAGGESNRTTGSTIT